MLSAKTVAQKPAGNFNPLSSFGHVWLLDSAVGLDSLCVDGASEPPVPIAASAARRDNRVLNASNNCIIKDSRRFGKIVPSQRSSSQELPADKGRRVDNAPNERSGHRSHRHTREVDQ